MGLVRCFITHDIWRSQGLGKSAGRVYDQLSSDPAASAESIGNQLGVKRRAVTPQLTKLKRYGLADYGSDGWVRGPADPDHLAAELGAPAKTEEQRRRHRERGAMRNEYFKRHRTGRKEEGRPSWWDVWWESLQPEPGLPRAS